MKKLMVLMMLLGLPGLSFAATRYVATTGTDSGNCTNINAKCKTINYAGSQAVGGDTILISPGVYAESIQCGSFPDGSASAATTIDGNGAGVIIRSNDDAGIFCQNSGSYITFSDLIVEGQNQNVSSGSHLIKFDGTFSNMIFTRMELRYGYASGALFGEDVTNSIIKYSKIHHLGYLPNGSNVCVGKDSTPPPTVDNGYCHAIYTFSPGLIILGNVLYNNDGLGVQAYDNTVNMFNNVVYDNTGYAGLFFNGSGTAKIYNNTVYDNLGFGVSASGGTGLVKNNIIYCNGVANCATQTDDLECGTGCTTQTNYFANPMFVNEAGNDFRLSCTSGADENGVTLTEVPKDILQVTRPQGSFYDRGAYEGCVP